MIIVYNQTKINSCYHYIPFLFHSPISPQIKTVSKISRYILRSTRHPYYRATKSLFDSFESSKFRKPSSYNPPGPPVLEAMILTNEIALNNRPEPKHPKLSNINRGGRWAITNLTRNRDIIIKPADKGSAVVVMDRSDYITEGYKQLCDTRFYKKVETDLMAQHMEIPSQTTPPRNWKK